MRNLLFVLDKYVFFSQTFSSILLILSRGCELTFGIALTRDMNYSKNRHQKFKDN